jgi:predicted nucleic acid-binding Zn ribbon protein
MSAATLGGVFGRWDEVVGEVVARHAQPVKLDGDRLVVEVDDPAWATQLSFLEQTVLARLSEALGPSSAPVRSFEIRVARRR